MKVLRNHFEGKPTIFVNSRIINGCQNFSLEEAPAVFDEYEVPQEMQQDVYDNYVQESTAEEILAFVNDEHWRVRKAVALQGYGLDVLVNDEDVDVRIAVALQGYGLDVLVKDKSWIVRKAVAEQGYGLDVLVNDSNLNVRKVVAEQGYGLDVLVNDKDICVRLAAKKYKCE